MQSFRDNGLVDAGTQQPNISVQVKNKKGKACRTAVRCWEICVLSAHLNHNSWDDKALPLNCLFHFSLLLFTCFLFPTSSDSIHHNTFSHCSSPSFSPTHIFSLQSFSLLSKDNATHAWQQRWQPNKATLEGTERQDFSDAFYLVVTSQW